MAAVDARCRRSHVRVVDWAHEAARLRAIRLAVFVVEQNIPEELEWDEFDARRAHCDRRRRARRSDRVRPAAARRLGIGAHGGDLGLARPRRRRGAARAR